MTDVTLLSDRSTRINELFRDWLASPQASQAFLFWVNDHKDEWQWVYEGLRMGLIGSEEPSIEILPILGPIVEQQEGSIPDLSQTKVSSFSGRILLVFSMTSSQQVTVTAAFRDKRGNPAAVDGVPEWLVDNSEVLALTPSSDGFSCLVKAVGPLGEGNLTLTADADLGEGKTPVVGTLQVTISAGAATVITLQPGTAEEQPEEPTPVV